MTESQRLELEAILNRAVARSRPALKYSRMSAEEFVIVWTYQRSVTVFTELAVVAGVCRTRGVAIPDEEVTEILNIAEPMLTRSGILALAEKYYEPGICWVLAECMGEQPHVINEIETRMCGRQIGKYLAVAPATIGKHVDTSPLGTFLWKDPKTKRLLTPRPVRDRRRNLKASDDFEEQSENLPLFRENEYEAHDLRAKGIVEANRLIDANSKVIPVDLPPYPLPLRPDVQRLWETTIAECFRQDIRNNAGRIKAGLSLDDAVIREKVRAHLRNFLATAERQRRLLNQAAAFNAQDESWRADFGKTISRQPEPQDRLDAEESRQETLEIAKRAYTLAVKRSGLKGRNFLKRLEAGCTIEEAARTAGIQPRTGHRILKTIRETAYNETAAKTKR